MRGPRAAQDLVVEVIDGKLRKRKRFTIADVSRYLDLDGDRYVRLLWRRGFLVAKKEREGGPITGFERSPTWPPPAGFFASGAIGVAYFLQNNFRYNLQDWIHRRMHELESKEGVYSLEGWNDPRAHSLDVESGAHSSTRELVVRADGDFQNTDAIRLAADIEMMRKPLDVSCRSLE